MAARSIQPVHLEKLGPCGNKTQKKKNKPLFDRVAVIKRIHENKIKTTPVTSAWHSLPFGCCSLRRHSVWQADHGQAAAALPGRHASRAPGLSDRAESCPIAHWLFPICCTALIPSLILHHLTLHVSLPFPITSFTWFLSSSVLKTDVWAYLHL